ncbi:MAG: PDZ domain-containing protein [Nitrospirae bacterium]|nr:PDZ domain-containing protein [Magnetococcales bacterium]
MFIFLLLVCFLTATPSSVLAFGWVGMTIEPPRGVQVGEIIKDGPADKAGLMRGDIVRKMDGQEVVAVEQFVVGIRSRAPGSPLVLHVLRDGKELEIKAIIEDGWNHQSVAQAPVSPVVRMRPDLGETGSSVPPSSPSDWNTGYSRGPWENVTASPPATTWLGIAPTMAQGGVGVMAVAPGSPGEKGGLLPRDIIVSINGQALATPHALVRLLSTMKPGDVVEINLNRNGLAQTVQVVLGVPPSSPPATPSATPPAPSSAPSSAPSATPPASEPPADLSGRS